MAVDSDQFRARVEQIFTDLDQYSYYELLNIDDSASFDDVRAAFHRMALSLHPDRHAQNPDDSLRASIYTIYKRICEGYRVLTDHNKRREYDQLLPTGERRLLTSHRPRTGPRRVEEKITHPQARKFFQLGQDAERRGDRKNARINYKFAMDLVGEHPTIQSKLDALDEGA